MKRKELICICAASLLMCNCVTASSAFAAGDSFIETELPLLYETGALGVQTIQTAQVKKGDAKRGEPDTEWFDPEDQQKEYEISTEQELMGLAELVNTKDVPWQAEGSYTFKGITIKLMRDIELTQFWTPIGTSDARAFEGLFEGNGHTISGIEIQDPNSDNLGLFGYLKGTVNNLNLQGSIDSRNSNAGGMAAVMAETALVENCTIDVAVTGKERVGGVAGTNHSGQIINCHSYGDIEGDVKVGGIVGENWNGTVRKCSNMGQVISNGKGFGTYGTGGIAGRSVAVNALIEECFNQGNILSSNECAGGIAGYVNTNGAAIRNCYNTGDVLGPESSALSSYGYVGGIVGNIGENGVIVKNCYNVGAVKNGKYAGGIAGNFATDHYDKRDTSVRGNYYLVGSAPLAIGQVEGAKGKPGYDERVELRSVTDLKSAYMTSVLGSAFQPDIGGAHGLNNGFPVLEWQKEELGTDYLESLETLDIPYTRQFQKFFQKYSYGTASGKMVLQLFNPRMYMEQVLESMENFTKK
ncbi:MAG: hypothetical protein HFE75_03525 [Firmicutes bacterium]|nr:hypothetical protein [Bacillota bacterium]